MKPTSNGHKYPKDKTIFVPAQMVFEAEFKLKVLGPQRLLKIAWYVQILELVLAWAFVTDSVMYCTGPKMFGSLSGGENLWLKTYENRV